MKKKQLNAFFEDVTTQYIPGGYIELFNSEAIDFGHMFYGVPIEAGCESIEMETKDEHFFFYKVAGRTFLQISAEKKNYNAAILKSLSKKIVAELLILIKQ